MDHLASKNVSFLKSAKNCQEVGFWVFWGGSCIFSQNFENFGKIAPPPNNTCPPWAGISGEKMTPAMKSNPKKMEYWGRTWHGCSFKIIKVPRSHYKITFRIEAFALQSTFGSDFFLLFFLVAWSLCGGWRMPLPRRLGGVSGPEAGNGKADIVPFSKTFWHGHPMPSPSEGLPSASFFFFPFFATAVIWKHRTITLPVLSCPSSWSRPGLAPAISCSVSHSGFLFILSPCYGQKGAQILWVTSALGTQKWKFSEAVCLSRTQSGSGTPVGVPVLGSTPRAAPQTYNEQDSLLCGNGNWNPSPNGTLSLVNVYC